MKCVKTSERLPERNDLYFCFISCGDEPFPSTVNYFSSSGWEIHEDYEVVSWLDESEHSYTEQDILEFVEWANQNYGYVEVNKWEGEEDSTYTTADILSRYKSLTKTKKATSNKTWKGK